MKVGDLVINERQEQIGIVLKVDEDAGLYSVWTFDDDLWDCEVDAAPWMARFTTLEVLDESR